MCVVIKEVLHTDSIPGVVYLQQLTVKQQIHQLLLFTT